MPILLGVLKKKNGGREWGPWINMGVSEGGLAKISIAKNV